MHRIRGYCCVPSVGDRNRLVPDAFGRTMRNDVARSVGTAPCSEKKRPVSTRSTVCPGTASTLHTAQRRLIPWQNSIKIANSLLLRGAGDCALFYHVTACRLSRGAKSAHSKSRDTTHRACSDAAHYLELWTRHGYELNFQRCICAAA